MNGHANTMNANTMNAITNKPIVGLHYVENPRPWWIPVGLEETHDKPSGYKPVSFGAEREWKNDDEGWQHYTTRKQRQNRRRQARRNANNDNYGFDDEDY